ncbi:cofilin/actin-depolymerizing factor homolog-related [Anaeramoeba flamelloides]|uniref:Cofilin/actin-depolymerizing factor homolog-related n=1 Tax=Anaeramoeba flamelloides TaxID=1746091 RepID=A0ABQ8X811_9EUKA|nr:cofilin/actin-depolymerizing factor homolog-related [Anaeramoeba flamelloides]
MIVYNSCVFVTLLTTVLRIIKNIKTPLFQNIFTLFSVIKFIFSDLKNHFFFFYLTYNPQMTGISTNDDCIEAYNDLKLNKKYRYVIFKLNDNDDEIVIDQTGDTNATYDDFTACLPSNECRYAVFDYEFDVEGQTRNKLLFVAWSPDNSRVRYKMLYSTTKSSFKKKLIGIGVEIQATDSSEIDREEVNDKVMKNVRK